jgi:hypothetical protein
LSEQKVTHVIHTCKKDLLKDNGQRNTFLREDSLLFSLPFSVADADLASGAFLIPGSAS